MTCRRGMRPNPGHLFHSFVSDGGAGNGEKGEAANSPRDEKADRTSRWDAGFRTCFIRQFCHLHFMIIFAADLMPITLDHRAPKVRPGVQWWKWRGRRDAAACLARTIFQCS